MVNSADSCGQSSDHESANSGSASRFDWYVGMLRHTGSILVLVLSDAHISTSRVCNWTVFKNHTHVDVTYCTVSTSDTSCTVMAVLVEDLQTQPLTFSHFYSPTTIGITIATLHTVFTHKLYWLSHSRVPRRFLYCPVLLALLRLHCRQSRCPY
jgi:hypothetical protein